MLMARKVIISAPSGQTSGLIGLINNKRKNSDVPPCSFKGCDDHILSLVYGNFNSKLYLHYNDRRKDSMISSYEGKKRKNIKNICLPFKVLKAVGRHLLIVNRYIDFRIV